MDNKTYIKRCIECKELFVTEHQADRKCPECKQKTKDQQAQKRSEENKSWDSSAKYKKPKISPAAAILTVEDYNREHGTCLTYGQYSLMIQLGKIENKHWGK